jgi:dTDP-4-amino-4,6-dideoxygalactose transaminase
MKEVSDSGLLTDGKYVEMLEQACAERVGCKYAVAVSSATSGLMLAMEAMFFVRGTLPAFTFSATAHSARRVDGGDCDIKLYDIDDSLCMVDDDVEDTALSVHMYGLAKPYKGKANLVVYDAAHSFGVLDNETIGDAAVCSFSPTKTITACEGGVVFTNTDVLADAIRLARNYGNKPDYSCRVVGLNARMSEVHAIIALEQLEQLDDTLAQRQKVVDVYRHELSGYEMQNTYGYKTTNKDFSVFIDPVKRDSVIAQLEAEGIQAKRYFCPCIHELEAYSYLGHEKGDFPHAERYSRSVVSLPVTNRMTVEDASEIAKVFKRIETEL